MKPMYKLLFLAALLQLPSPLQAQPMFVYDKPDEIIAATELENPLFYDAAVAVAGGNTVLTWLEFLPGKGDVVWFGLRDATGKWIEKQQVTKDPGDYANPTVTVDGKKNLWISYEAVREGKWNVMAAKRKNDSFASLVVLNQNGSKANINHHVAPSSNGGIWIAWQSDNHGQFDIFAAHVDENGSAAQTFQVSDSPLGDWHPSITVTPSNEVVVVWDSYDGRSYNIRARELSEGKWGDTLNITSSTNFNANAQITSDQKGRIWISWEEDGPNWGKAYRARVEARKDSEKMSDDVGSLHRFRKLHLAELLASEQELRIREVPQPSFSAAVTRSNAPAGIKQLGVFYQSSQLVVDGLDRLWLVYRHFYMPAMGITKQNHLQDDWGIYARCLEKDVWSKLYRFDEGQGDALQRISVAPQTEGVSVAWTFGRTDRRNPQNWMEDKLAPEKVVAYVATKGAAHADDDEDEVAAASPKKKKGKKAASAQHGDVVEKPSRGVALASIRAGAKHEGRGTVPSKVETLSIRSERKQNITAKPSRPAYDFNGKHYELFFGDFHRHTDISLCFWPGDGTMDDAYRYGIDAAPLDFLGVTDHTHDIAMGDPLSLLWQRIRKEVNRHALADSFIPFYSYERSRGDTDHNVISLRDDMLRPHTYPHSEFWKELDTNTFTIPHQPFNSVLWKTNDRMHRPLMEIFQGFRNHSCEKDAKEGLASGNEVGFIASSDHLSTGASYACVWAEQPTRESIFRALQARRTFAATDHIRLRVTCGDHWMGEKFTVKEAPKINVDIKSTADLKAIELFIDGESQQIGGLNVEGNPYLIQSAFTADKQLTGSHTFFVRVTQNDGNMAWSSPMWINIQR